MDEENCPDESDHRPEVTAGGAMPDAQNRDGKGEEKKSAVRYVSPLLLELFFSGVVALFTVATGIVAYRQLDSLTEARKANDLAQRPLISFGAQDGKLAEYFPPRGGAEKGTIALYFQNSGGGPARNFYFSAWATLPSDLADDGRGEGVDIEPPIHRRDFVLKNLGWGGRIGRYGIPLSAKGMASLPLDAKFTPSPEDWSLIEHGDADFMIDGIVGWCDYEGRYFCEPFGVRYDANVGRFLSSGNPLDLINPCEYGLPKSALQPQEEVTWLHPCEQPEEAEEKRAKWQAELERRRSESSPKPRPR
jgi:hypothetical protein